MKNVHLVIIDPQNDFMDGGPLGVPGATEDMRRVAKMIGRIGNKLQDIHVTLDSHRILDIAHPDMWRGQDGKGIPPFTQISSDDIKADIWTPRNPNAKPSALAGKTIREYAIWYTEQLETSGLYPLIVWPPHCLIGTTGHTVQEDLMKALIEWEVKRFASVDYVTKGTNIWTEHYGALQAEVPMRNDPSSSLNNDFLGILAEADIVAVAGEALSHCVKATVTQIADNIGNEHIQKFHILTDGTSPIPKIGDGPDFPQISQDWLKEMEGRGMTLTTTTEFLS